MNINLTPEQEELVQTKLRSGGYSSASEVVQEALRLLEARDKTHRLLRKKLTRDSSRLAEGTLSTAKSFSKSSSERSGNWSVNTR